MGQVGDETPAQVVALSWGVKQSFRSYVEATGGAIEAGGGATRAADGGFTFAATAGGALQVSDSGALTGRGGFAGEVRFEAHGGMLAVFLADPQVELGASGAVLTVADSPARDRRLTLAQLDLAAMTRSEDELIVPAALAMEGVQLLGDHYSPLTPLDSVRLRLTPRAG